MNRTIYLDSVNAVIDNMAKTTKNKVFLVGSEGSGKTTVLNVLKEQDKNVVDVSLNYGEFICIHNEKIFNLYHVCLIVKKLLLHTRLRNEQVFLSSFVNLYNKVDNILQNIEFVQMIRNDDKTQEMINNDLLENPEVLIEEYLEIATKKLDSKNITLIIDNFDTVGESSRMYQNYLYHKLSNYLKIIATISAKDAINDQKLLNNLEVSSDLVNVKYNEDINVIKKIYDCKLLDDTTLEEIILKTNGNLFDISGALNYLNKNKSNLRKEDYREFILKYIDRVINIDPILTGIIPEDRKLYIR